PESLSERKIRQSPIDVAEAQGQLIGVRQVDLASAVEARRTQRQFPAVDACALNRNGKEDVGVIQAIVIEEILAASKKIVCIQAPAVKGDRHAELVLFVALSVKRHKPETLVGHELNQRARRGNQWRGLIEMSVESAKHPV